MRHSLSDWATNPTAYYTQTGRGGGYDFRISRRSIAQVSYEGLPFGDSIVFLKRSPRPPGPMPGALMSSRSLSYSPKLKERRVPAAKTWPMSPCYCGQSATTEPIPYHHRVDSNSGDRDAGTSPA